MAKETGIYRPSGSAYLQNTTSRPRRSYAATSRLQQFADSVISDGLKRGREMVVGSINYDIVSDLRGKGIELETTDVVITDGVIMKYLNHPKASKGATVDPKKYWLVERTLKSPTHIYEHKDGKYLVYVNTRAYAKGRVLKIVVQPNYRHKGQTKNLLKSIGVVNTGNMDNTTDYRKIK